ncbi:MAG TPA: hypothetical protein ENJ99_02700 [Rhizobiales bacterium]|nr:hypothetical protein [Hyphomicrobiales bacterium]
MVSAKKTPGKKTTARKPPVINLEAKEIKETGKDKAAPGSDKKPAKPSAAAKPAAKKPATSSAASKAGAAKKPGESKPPSGDAKPGPAAKKRSRKPLIIASLATLVIAAGAGAWGYRQYGVKYFPPAGAVQASDLEALRARVAKAEEEAALARKAGSRLKADIDDLAAKLEALSSRPAAPVVDNSGKVSALDARLAKSESRLAKNSTAIANLASALKAAALAGGNDKANGPANLQLAETVNKLAELSGAVAAMQKSLGELKQAAVTSDQLAPLAERIAALEKTAAGLAAKTDDLAKKAKKASDSPEGKLARAFTVLRAAINSGKPYVHELDEVASLLPSAKQLDVLRQSAETGLPTPDKLAKGLDAVLAGLAKPADKTDAKAPSGGLWSKVKGRLARVVTVKKIGETDWPATLGKARALTAGGKTAEAAALLASQKAAPPEGVAAWLKQAQTTLKARQALDSLSDVVTSQLTASKS